MFKSKLIISVLVVLFTISITSCDKDDDATPPVVNEVSIKLDKSSVDFEKVKQGDSKEVILKLTNSSKATINSLSSKVTISGGAIGVSFKFSPLAPGKSINIPVKFTSAKTTKLGIYQGKLILTPSNGKPVEVSLSVNVVKADDKPVEGKVVVDKNAINFGSLPKGTGTESMKEVIVKLTNNTNKTLEGLTQKLSTSGVGSVKATLVNFSSLAPGKSINIPVKFTSGDTDPGSFKGTLTLTPSIGEPIIVNLSAMVIAANVTGSIVVDKNSIDFGSLPKGTGTASMKEVIVKLTNNTNKTLEGLTHKLSTSPGVVGSVEATLVNFSSLAPGKSINIPVKFTSGNTDPGSFKGTLTLTPSIGNPIEIKLSATVTDSGTVTGPTTGKVVVDKQSVNFGSFSKPGLAKKVTIKLTNNTNKTINSIKLDFFTSSTNGSSSSSITLSGNSSTSRTHLTNNGSIKLGSKFSPLAPGKDVFITLDFTSGNSGNFNGKLTITPSIGAPIDVLLSSSVK
ncbi:uncharacterized protein DUF1573 [Aquimarina sp. MAR_2010_214]|nr:uncharacterized protein DUF1573 [Aquimarina sp. MAR_2010_214]